MDYLDSSRTRRLLAVAAAVVALEVVEVRICTAETHTTTPLVLARASWCGQTGGVWWLAAGSRDGEGGDEDCNRSGGGGTGREKEKEEARGWEGWDGTSR
ncbi:unnamed protein product [Calypogeia fissa]